MFYNLVRMGMSLGFLVLRTLDGQLGLILMASDYRSGSNDK